MALIQSGVSGATLMTVDPTFNAARVAIRPVEQLGTYAVGAFTGAYTGAGANTPLFSMRFVAGSAGSAQIAIVQRVTLSFVQTTAFTLPSKWVLVCLWPARSPALTLAAPRSLSLVTTRNTVPPCRPRRSPPTVTCVSLLPQL